MPDAGSLASCAGSIAADGRVRAVRYGECASSLAHVAHGAVRRAPVRAIAAAKRGSAIQWRLRTVRQESARELVLALRAGLERVQAFAQAVIDALVVAGLEMQAVDCLARAPVAAVQRVALRRHSAPAIGLAVASARNSTSCRGIARARWRKKSSVSAGELPYVVERRR